MAGVSGGADSVCLLLVLSALRQEIPFELLVVHVNHKIRKEAGRDAAYVQEICGQLQIPFFLVEEDVEALAKDRGISTEEAGRQVRYSAFETVLKEKAPKALQNGTAKIAVAHNQNDRAETMLFHLFRGSGLSGLGSIRPVKEREGFPTVIRPLLGTKRNEIEAYLTEKGVSWCIDSTNDEDTYTRNKIRHHILPYAEEVVAGGAVANMSRAADILVQTQDFVQIETRKAYAVCVEAKDSMPVSVMVQKFLTFHPLLQKQMLLYCLECYAPGRKDITATHITEMLSLFTKDGNREIHLPYGLTARREYEKVVIEKQVFSNKEPAKQVEAEKRGKYPIEVVLPAPGEASVCIPLSAGNCMEFSVFSYEKTMEIPQNQYTKWFDYGKMSKSLTIRTRQVGDYFTFNTALQRKTVQDYMVEAKIPKGERDRIPILADGQQAVWIAGYRTGSSYKVDELTKYILQVRLRGEQ